MDLVEQAMALMREGGVGVDVVTYNSILTSIMNRAQVQHNACREKQGEEEYRAKPYIPLADSRSPP